MIWEAIQKAKTNKKDLDIIWLDLANAYGSVPHQMILLSLWMYHIPKKISKMLGTYFDGFLMRFTTIGTGLKLELRWDVRCHQYFSF